MQHRKLIATNRRTRYLLTIIVVLSKYAWVVGLKSKRGTAVRNAFQHVLETHPERRPTHLQTDQGKEFYNKHMKRLLDDWHQSLLHPGRTQSCRGRTVQSDVERNDEQVHDGS